MSRKLKFNRAAGCCERGYESSGSIEDWEFIDQLDDC
jgi:hypothetical protein